MTQNDAHLSPRQWDRVGIPQSKLDGSNFVQWCCISAMTAEGHGVKLLLTHELNPTNQSQVKLANCFKIFLAYTIHLAYLPHITKNTSLEICKLLTKNELKEYVLKIARFETVPPFDECKTQAKYFEHHQKRRTAIIYADPEYFLRKPAAGLIAEIFAELPKNVDSRILFTKYSVIAADIID